jgi:hypothetical protein
MTLHRFYLMEPFSILGDLNSTTQWTDSAQPLFHLFLCHLLTFSGEILIAPHPIPLPKGGVRGPFHSIFITGNFSKGHIPFGRNPNS